MDFALLVELHFWFGKDVKGRYSCFQCPKESGKPESYHAADLPVQLHYLQLVSLQ